MKSIGTYLVLGALAGATLFAQGPRGPQTPGAQTRNGSGLDLSKAQSINGTVSAVNIGYGAQYPSIVVNQVSIQVAPVWFLLENDFELKTGNAVTVLAAPSIANGYLHAIEVTNTVSGARILLRSATGVPLWTGSAMRRGVGNGQGDGPQACGGCVDASTAVVASGGIDQINAGVGIQMPALVLKTSDGALITIRIGPERVLLSADFPLKQGDMLTVRYAVATCTGENVALSLTNAAGETLTLRNDDGSPAWR